MGAGGAAAGTGTVLRPGAAGRDRVTATEAAAAPLLAQAGRSPARTRAREAPVLATAVAPESRAPTRQTA